MSIEDRVTDLKEVVVLFGDFKGEIEEQEAGVLGLSELRLQDELLQEEGEVRPLLLGEVRPKV
jgi:hypothetical protein